MPRASGAQPAVSRVSLTSAHLASLETRPSSPSLGCGEGVGRRRQVQTRPASPPPSPPCSPSLTRRPPATSRPLLSPRAPAASSPSIHERPARPARVLAASSQLPRGEFRGARAAHAPPRGPHRVSAAARGAGKPRGPPGRRSAARRRASQRAPARVGDSRLSCNATSGPPPSSPWSLTSSIALPLSCHSLSVHPPRRPRCRTRRS